MDNAGLSRFAPRNDGVRGEAVCFSATRRVSKGERGKMCEKQVDLAWQTFRDAADFEKLKSRTKRRQVESVPAPSGINTLCPINL